MTSKTNSATTVNDISTSPAETEERLAVAAAAAPAWAANSPEQRAEVLLAVADALDASADDLVPVGMSETSLPEGRLRNELLRTSFQLRLFADILRDGGYEDARIDHADADWPMGARPDLRRHMRPLGPVAVYAASNFPFAFSVIGGDTASALAAGNPVIVKVHPGHPELSELTARVVRGALEKAGVSPDLLNLVHGRTAATTLVKDHRIRAAGFTGSIPGGRSLLDLATSRPDPIPFYGELGSNNPVFVTPGAAAARGSDIVTEFIGSFTLGAGQFCTKPGTLFVPADSGMVEALEKATLPAPATLLNERIQSGYTETLGTLSGHGSIRVLNQGPEPVADPPSPTLLFTDIDSFFADPEVLRTECFGPAALVIAYDSADQMETAAMTFDGQLTATLQAENDCPVSDLVGILAEKAGRVLWNQWPTGVSVTYAQQHGGPYPATTAAGTTSVGTAAIERFQRPVAYQNFPAHLLPTALRDDNPRGVPQLVDGVRKEGAN